MSSVNHINYRTSKWHFHTTYFYHIINKLNNENPRNSQCTVYEQCLHYQKLQCLKYQKFTLPESLWLQFLIFSSRINFMIAMNAVAVDSSYKTQLWCFNVSGNVKGNYGFCHSNKIVSPFDFHLADKIIQYEISLRLLHEWI